MRVVPLRLIRGPHAIRATSAWLVPGRSPTEWLHEIAHWPVKQAALRFLLLPRATDHDVDAVLVLIDEPLPESFRPARAQPYGLITNKVYAPVEALVEPVVTATEWTELLPGEDAIYVWRAQGDLVGFEAADVRSVAELLTAQVERSSCWTEARELPAFATRLRSISSSMPLPTLEDVAENWRNDIGSPAAPGKLPPLSGEPPLHWTERLAQSTAGVRKAGRRLAHSFTSLYQRFRGIMQAIGLVLIGLLLYVFLRNLGSGLFGSWTEFLIFLLISALAATLIGLGRFFDGPTRDASTSPRNTATSGGRSSRSIWNWLSRRFAAAMPKGLSFSPFAEADRRQREREVQRLMRMLEQNPDEGLRYAIPFGGEAGRGVASPGNQLVAHDLNFRFGFGSGMAADMWNISVEQQLRLTASYRTLAEREQRAGRHRRAAYIYSALLNDWRSAATALTAGHHYADAAVIYEKRLQNIVEASQCYELAGQFDKALRLYVDSLNWIAAGDLCTRTERPEEAREHYRAAVIATLTTGNTRHAAELLETKLRETDEALTLLWDAWPGDRQSDACLDAWFDLTARHQRFDTAIERVEVLSRQTTQLEALRVLPRLLRVHQHYPHANVQRTASEATLQVVARHLTDAVPSAAQSLTSFLPGLVPNDRLLSRDCQRYVEQCRAQAPVPVKPPSKPPARLRLEHQFSLPEKSVSGPAIASPHGWVLLMESVDYGPQDLILTSWEAVVAVVPLARSAHPLRLLGVDPHRREVWLKSSLPPISFYWPADDKPWNALWPKAWPDHTILALPGATLTRVLHFDQFFAGWLSLFAGFGRIACIRSVRIAEEWLGDPKHVVPLMRGKAVLHSLGSHDTFVFLPIGDGQFVGERFDQEGVRVWTSILPAEKIVCAAIHHACSVLLLQNDAAIVIDDVCLPETTPRKLTGWHDPEAAFLDGELFVVVDEHRIAIFNLGSSAPIFETTHAAASPIAVTGCGIGRCSVVRSDGSVEQWTW